MSPPGLPAFRKAELYTKAGLHARGWKPGETGGFKFMDIATTISIGAVLVSLGSLSVTIWATRLSKRSLNHAKEIQEKAEEKEFERMRVELLMQIADDRRLLDKTRIKIGTLKVDFDAEPQPIQVIMRNYTSLFTNYLPRVESSINQLDILWKEVSGWSNEKSYRELMDAKAVLYRSLKDDEVVYDSGIYMVNEFKAQLEVARQRVS
jgi:hypothetical protein